MWYHYARCQCTSWVNKRNLETTSEIGKRSPIEFQVRRCDPWSVCYKKDSQAWGYRMRLLSSIFPQHSLSYKMPLRFNNLDIGGGFPLLQNAPSFSTTVSYKDIPFDKPAWSSSCHATKCHCDFHDGLTWLKWLLYKMRFTSLSYKILDLDFISGLAWLKWKPLYSACGHKLCSLNSQGDGKRGKSGHQKRT